MRCAAAAVLAALLCACAAPDRGPVYTRAGIVSLPTAELAARLLPAEDAARIEQHWINYEPGMVVASLSFVTFAARPRPLDDDLCGRDFFLVDFAVAGRDSRAGRDRDPPRRVSSIRRTTRISHAPGCDDIPGRRFAYISGPDLGFEEGIAILRTLADARATANGPGPLPFRLRCDQSNSEDPNFDCPADPRWMLANMPLHQAGLIARRPFPLFARGRCVREEGDIVEIGHPGVPEQSGHIWEVRLKDMGTDRAEIILSWQVPRQQVTHRCG